MKTTTDPFDVAFEDRLSWLLSAIEKVRNTKAAELSPQMRYLLFLSDKRILSSLRYAPRHEPAKLPGDSGSFSFSLDQGEIRFSRSLKRTWLAMAEDLTLGQQGLEDSIDNFILHELFHVGQDLTTERHADIRHAQAVLRVVDYYADANAVLAAIVLQSALDKTSSTDWRDLYPRLIGAVLTQMYVFDFANGAKTMMPARFIRHFTWHYQFHRVAAFRGADSFQRLQLLVEPAFSFRNVDGIANANGLTSGWPEEERDEDARDKPHLWMAVPNDFGVPQVYRFLSTKKQNYVALFEGVFERNTEKTSHFIREMLNQFGELIGARTDTEERKTTSGLTAPPTSAKNPAYEQLYEAFKREKWIDMLSDEGDRQLDVKAAFESVLRHDSFAQFLAKSGLYFGWNKNQIDEHRESAEAEYLVIRDKYASAFAEGSLLRSLN